MAQNPYDQASRYTAKLDPPGFLNWLLGQPPRSPIFRHWLDTRTLPFPGEPDRVCDTVAGLTHDADPDTWWALAIEFERRAKATMFGRLLEYLGRLWLELRPPGGDERRYEVVAAVVNLTGTGRTSRAIALPDTNVGTCLRVAELNLAEQDAAATLAGIAAGRIAPAVLPWLPLMQSGASAAIIEQWKELASAEPDPRRRADYAGLALVFADLLERRPQWKHALEGWNVEQSQQVLEWQAEAEQRGKIAGKAEGKADAVLRLLERRFSSPVPAALATATRALTDLTRLDQLLDIGLAAASIEDFRRQAQL